MTTSNIELIPIQGIPEIKEGDNLSQILLDALQSQELELIEKDIIVIAQKIVSKSEGRIVDLNSGFKELLFQLL